MEQLGEYNLLVDYFTYSGPLYKQFGILRSHPDMLGDFLAT